jgi:hypothetical protein
LKSDVERSALEGRAPINFVKVGKLYLARLSDVLSALGLAEPMKPATEVKAEADDPRSRILRLISGGSRGGR